MTACQKFSFLFLTSSLVACAASTEGLEETGPITNSEGFVNNQRNLLLSDLSHNSPGNGRATDEIFELPVSTFRVAPTDNGASNPGLNQDLGLVQDSASREGFAENAMTFIAATNEFQFNIDTDAGAVSPSVFNALLADPSEISSLENSRAAKFIASNPLLTFAGNVPVNFQDSYPLPGITPSSSVTEIANAITALQESGVEADNDYATTVLAAADGYIDAGDQYLYGYQLTDGNGYVQFTNMNDSREEGRDTDTVAIVSVIERYDDGGEYHSHGVFGHRTPNPEVPTSGTASYNGKVVGSVLTNNSVRSLTGGATLDVNFSTGLMDVEIATSIREGGNNNGSTTFLDYKTVSGSGVISDNTFSGTLNEDAGNSTGEFEGGFFGPIANEVGGTFAFGDDASFAAGAFTGVQDDDEE